MGVVNVLHAGLASLDRSPASEVDKRRAGEVSGGDGDGARMKLVMWLGLVASGDALAGEPLFVPSFTANTPNEASLAETLERAVINRLRDDGHVVIDDEVAGTVVAPVAFARCAVLPTCPGEVLPQLPARFSVVARIDKLSDGTILGHVEYYQVSTPAALRIIDTAVAKDGVAAFADEVARNTNAIVEETGPSTDAMRKEARALIASARPGVVPKPAPAASPAAPEPPPEPPPTPAAPPSGYAELPVAPPAPPPPDDPEPTPIVGPRGDGSEPHTAPIAELIDGTGVKRRYLVGAEGHFKRSGLDPRDYLYEATPHAGRVTIEVRAGFGSGDINRRARLRAELIDDEQTRSWYREGPDTGQSFRGEFVLGYAPVTVLDIGMLVGLQYGERIVNTGTYAITSSTAQVVRQSDGRQTLALNVYLQPRMRLFLVPFGPAKPFVVGGGEFRFIDGYSVAAGSVTYPTPEPGIVPGAFGGAGMMIDAGPIVGLFAEATYTAHFGPRSVPSEGTRGGQWTYSEDPFPESQRSTVAINGGVQFRL